MIEIRPDPAHPHGGYAILSTGTSALPDDTVVIDVFDKFKGYYLGENGFQPTRNLFGPYKVVRAGGRAEVLIGSEIVNHIEEYANLRLTLGPVVADVSWPDTVLPAAGALPVGGIYVAPKPGSTLSGAAPADKPAAPPQPVPEPATETGKDAKSRLPSILAGLVVLAILAGGAYWVFGRTPAVVPVPPGPNPCSAGALATLGAKGFAPVLAQLRLCGGQISVDDVLLQVEKASAAGDAVAITVFGQLYDGAQTDPVETATGLTFDDDPARAAEYYARAKAAGGEDAGPLLAQICVRLQPLTDTLSRSAYADYCGT